MKAKSKPFKVLKKSPDFYVFKIEILKTCKSRLKKYEERGVINSVFKDNCLYEISKIQDDLEKCIDLNTPLSGLILKKVISPIIDDLDEIKILIAENAVSNNAFLISDIIQEV